MDFSKYITKNAIAVVLLFIAFSSCKKDNKKSTQTSGKLYNVTFNASGFSQQHNNFPGETLKKLNSAADTEVFADKYPKYKVLYLETFTPSSAGPQWGYYTQDQVQYEGDPNFGTFNLKLLAGTYTFAISGGENESPGSAFYPGKYFTFTGYYTRPACCGDPVLADPNDFFYKEFTVTVGNTDFNQNITLDHVVGKLDVVIQDAIPQNITSIIIGAGSPAYTYQYNLGGPQITSYRNINDTFIISNALHGTTNFKMATYILNTVSPFWVQIVAYNGSTMVAHKVINNVKCTANTVTTLSGNLFGGSATVGNSSANIKIDTSWTGTPTQYHF